MRKTRLMHKYGIILYYAFAPFLTGIPSILLASADDLGAFRPSSLKKSGSCAVVPRLAEIDSDPEFPPRLPEVHGSRERLPRTGSEPGAGARSTTKVRRVGRAAFPDRDGEPGCRRPVVPGLRRHQLDGGGAELEDGPALETRAARRNGCGGSSCPGLFGPSPDVAFTIAGLDPASRRARAGPRAGAIAIGGVGGEPAEQKPVGARSPAAEIHAPPRSCRVRSNSVS